MRVSSGKVAAVAALALAGAVIAGCSKKSEYGADTSAAAMTRADTTTYTASSTAPAMQDTTAASTSASKTSTRKTTTKKTTTKKSY
ncbi:MAG TPA: hypothetical protein VGJ62_03560 [Gemmatimonadaceae bacterium]